MSHHYSGSDLGFQHGDARLDLTDLYGPHKPEGDRGQGRAPRRSACRVPLFGAAAQHLCAEPCNFAYRNRASQGVQAPGLFMKEAVMNRLEKVLYTAKAHTTGGRAGRSPPSAPPPALPSSRPRPTA